MAVVYLGLGSNLEQPALQLQKALDALNALSDVTLLQSSQFYDSTPQGPQDQPDYVNAVCKVATDLAPEALLDLTQSIEQSFGRVKTRYWGERCIDVDILLYDDFECETERLTLPHSFMHQRDFVLVPLLEIAPAITIPKIGAASACLDALQERFIKAAL